MSRKPRSYHLHIHVNDTSDGVSGFLTHGDTQPSIPRSAGFELFESAGGVYNQRDLDQIVAVIDDQARDEGAKWVRVRKTGQVEWQGSRGLSSVTLYHGRHKSNNEDLAYVKTKLEGLGWTIRSAMVK
jgi:hypothetical protein